MNRETHTIDASGKTLGRLASKIAPLLRGKNKPIFEPHKDVGDEVVIENISEMEVSGKKKDQKKYHDYSGYPGGLNETSLGEMMENRPEEVLRRAVKGMLPKNKLRDQQIKRLKFE